MVADLSPAERLRIAAAAASGKPAPDGPVIDRFQPLPLANALEMEATRALMLGVATRTPGKVEIYLDPRDAIELAQFLRKHGS